MLQHFIDNCAALLNGDWCFLNTVLGLMAPSAKHPCPICIINSSNFAGTSRYRLPDDKHSMHESQFPLLRLDPNKIVPIPLHLFLGIGNRIILKSFGSLFGKENVETMLKSVKTTHSAGCSGSSDLHELNGKELKQWIKLDCSKQLLDATASGSNVATIKATHSTLSGWLIQLEKQLLRKEQWTQQNIDDWKVLIKHMQEFWRLESGSDLFPKLHMLKHTAEFVERFRFLGRASEAPIESYHAQFNTLFHKHHLNLGNQTAERLRRCLADCSLQAMQPCILKNTQ